MDARLADHLTDRFIAMKSSRKTTISEKAKTRLIAACERAKQVLGTVQETRVEVEAFHEGNDLTFPMSRNGLEELCKDEIDRVGHVAAEAMRKYQSHLATTTTTTTTTTTKTETSETTRMIDGIEVVGGGMRSPMMQQSVLRGIGMTGKMQVSRSLDSASSAAMGAAIIAANIKDSQQQQSEGETTTKKKKKTMVMRIKVEDEEMTKNVKGKMKEEEMEQSKRVAKELDDIDRAMKERQQRRHELESFIFEKRARLTTISTTTTTTTTTSTSTGNSSSNKEMKLTTEEKEAVMEVLMKAEKWIEEVEEAGMEETEEGDGCGCECGGGGKKFVEKMKQVEEEIEKASAKFA